ncbi:hypothetical protein [Streptomyces sp. DSM 40484]|uniref:hypothetical protein n=1 Tax=Streptomyces kroppenstedtii TaxID=3051181 RepID=UPI0028D37A4F|nr:hypothetical protein [Streptomyces sp. DSM 40484]
MSQKAAGLAAMGSPFAVALPAGVMPWQAELTLALAGPLVFVLHRFWMHRLACRALKCAAQDDVTAVLAFGSGQQPPAPRR